LHARWKLCRC